MVDVSIRNLSFAYDDELILGGINMEVEAGSFVCLLGQSGCGKSTLLRLLAGLETAKPGELYVGNKPVTSPSLDRTMIFQDYGLFPWMTAGENITIALKQKFRDWKPDKIKSVALEWMGKVGLGEIIYDKLPMELSGGQRQRCATARAFALDAPVMLLDEPFGALDAVTKALLQDTVLELWEQEGEKRKTMFFVTHSVDEALLLATDIFVLGQSPSTVIYTYSFKGEKKPHKDMMFSDPHMMRLRNTIIKIIDDEIREKAEQLATAV